MRILFFAQLQDATHCHAVELALPAPVNAAQLWEILLGKFPPLAPHQKHVRLARNWEYAGQETLFADTDEVALIPPVSGG